MTAGVKIAAASGVLWRLAEAAALQINVAAFEIVGRLGHADVFQFNGVAKFQKLAIFYNKRGTCEQWIKEGKGAIKWTRLSCRSFAANAVRLQLHALAYNLGNFLRTLATPEPIKDWSLTSLKEKLIKIGAKVVTHGRYVAFQMAEVAIPRNLFGDILRLIAELRPPPDPAPA